MTKKNDIIQQPFMIRALKKQRIVGMHVNIIEAMYDKARDDWVQALQVF
jgi:hypothetical protein